jgi:hypothetical protein
MKITPDIWPGRLEMEPSILPQTAMSCRLLDLPPPPGLSQKGVSTQWAPEVSSAGFNPSDVDVQSKKFEFIDIISAVPLNNVLCCMPYSPQSYTLVCLKKK